MDRLEYWSAAAAALCSIGAMLTVGTPAIMHYNVVTGTEWRTGIFLAVAAAVFFTTSVTTAIVGGVRRRGKTRNGDSIKEE